MKPLLFFFIFFMRLLHERRQDSCLLNHTKKFSLPPLFLTAPVVMNNHPDERDASLIFIKWIFLVSIYLLICAGA